jgi:hypothetical protein
VQSPAILVLVVASSVTTHVAQSRLHRKQQPVTIVAAAAAPKRLVCIIVESPQSFVGRLLRNDHEPEPWQVSLGSSATL